VVSLPVEMTGSSQRRGGNRGGGCAATRSCSLQKTF